MKADSKTTSAPVKGLRDGGTSSAGTDAAALKAAAALFNQVAHLTDTMRTMGALIVEAVGEADDTGSDAAVHYGVIVEQLAAQIGAIADRGARLCGDTGTVGNFEDWLLNPAARSALQVASMARSQAAA